MAFYLKSGNNLQSDRLSPRFHAKTLPSILAGKKAMSHGIKGGINKRQNLPLREIAFEGKEILYGRDKLNTRSG